MPKDAQPLKVMVSSSVHADARSLLRQVYGVLSGYGYEVSCSPVGTVAVNPSKTNLNNCLKAVDECDVFIGFVRPIYGSGRDSKDDKSITHLELERAVEQEKPRWVLAHSSVVKMRSLLRKVFYHKDGSRNDVVFHGLKNEFDDLRVIDMYDLATNAKSELPWSQRSNQWVHEYHYDFEALDYINAQLSDCERVRGFLGGWN